MGGEGEMRILVIEDEPDIGLVFEMVLRRRGHDMIEARSAADGIAGVTREQPDLILLDIMLPDRHGLDVLGDLKAKDETKAIPVVIVSAKAEPVDQERGLMLGAAAYVTKPFAPAELVDVIEWVAAASTDDREARRAEAIESLRELTGLGDG